MHEHTRDEKTCEYRVPGRRRESYRLEDEGEQKEKQTKRTEQSINTMDQISEFKKNLYKSSKLVTMLIIVPVRTWSGHVLA